MKPGRETRRKFLKGIASGIILVGGVAIVPEMAEAQVKAPAKGIAGAAGAKGAAGAGAKGAAAAGANGGNGENDENGNGPVSPPEPIAPRAVQDIPFGAEGVIVAAILGYGVYRIRKEARKSPDGGAAAAAAAG